MTKSIAALLCSTAVALIIVPTSLASLAERSDPTTTESFLQPHHLLLSLVLLPDAAKLILVGSLLFGLASALKRLH